MTDTLRAFEAGGTDVVVGNGRPPSGGSGPVERVQIGRPVLPCDRCSHQVVCSIKPKLQAAAIEVKAPTSPDPNVRITVHVDLTCAFFAGDGSPLEVAPKRIVTDLRDKALKGAAASKAAHAARASGPPPTGRRGRHTIEEIEAAIVKHGSMAKAAIALGYASGWAISQRLTAAGRPVPGATETPA